MIIYEFIEVILYLCCLFVAVRICTNISDKTQKFVVNLIRIYPECITTMTYVKYCDTRYHKHKLLVNNGDRHGDGGQLPSQ